MSKSIATNDSDTSSAGSKTQSHPEAGTDPLPAPILTDDDLKLLAKLVQVLRRVPDGDLAGIQAANGAGSGSDQVHREAKASGREEAIDELPETPRKAASSASDASANAERKTEQPTGGKGKEREDQGGAVGGQGNILDNGINLEG